MINTLKIFRAESTSPYHNLAVEEYLTSHVKDGEIILYLWQNANTIVIGRNQNAWKECRVSDFEKDGGRIVRRLSGGGAVYHDAGNLNFTFCVKKADYDVDRQLSVIISAVKALGADAQKTGRNDITTKDGRKFSGNAFYRSGSSCYHHGTLLLNADTALMTKYLNVDAAKLQAKGVKSVKSRVANLIEYCPFITPDLTAKKLIGAADEIYNAAPRFIEEKDLSAAQIAQLERKFSDWNWIFGQKIPFTHQLKKRFSWGDIDMQLFVSAGKINRINIYSDIMEQDFILLLKKNLLNCRYIKEEIISQAQKAVFSSSFYISSRERIEQDITDLINAEI